MRLNFEPSPVFFMHVPKTAGTTLQTWLRRHYRPDQTLIYQNPSDSAVARANDQNIRLIYAKHVGRCAYDLLSRPDLAVFTILRDPVERSVSAFYHHQRYMRQHGHADFGFVEAFANYSIAEGTIDDHIHAAPVQQLVGNSQVNCLVASDLFERLSASGRLPANSAPPTVETAFRWLADMQFVGLTDEYSATVEQISALLGIPLQGSEQRKRPNRDRPLSARYREQLRPTTLALLEELNRDDIELYRRGKELFQQHTARFRSRPQRTYSIAAYGRLALKSIQRRLVRTAGDPTS